MPDPTSVLRVALPVPLPRLFDYLPPAGMEATAIAVGQRLQVPFGQREVCGIVIGHGHAEPGVELRQALRLPDPEPLLRGELLASLQWLAGYLHAPIGEVLATALPAPLRRGEPAPDTTAYGWTLNEAGHTALPAMRSGKPKALATLLATLRAEDWLDAEVPGWRASLRGLRERGLVEREKVGSELPLRRKGDSDPTFSRSTRPRSRRPRSDVRQPGNSSSSQSSARTLASNVASTFGLPLRIAGRAVWPASFNAQP